MLLARGELKDIVIPCRHTQFSPAKQPSAILHAAGRVGIAVVNPVVVVAVAENDGAERERRNVDQQTSEPGELYARSELIALPMSD